MVNSKNVIAALGVVAGLGASVMPLTTYAADPQTSDKTIRATVGDVFELSVTSSTDMDADKTTAISIDRNDKDTTLIHTVRVQGNLIGGYHVNLGSKTAQTSLLWVSTPAEDVGAAARYDSTIFIPTGTDISEGNAAWGYRVNTPDLANDTPASDTFTDGAFLAIQPAASAAEIFQNPNTSKTSFDDTLYVNYGISTAATQAAGTYEGQVTYTATAGVN